MVELPYRSEDLIRLVKAAFPLADLFPDLKDTPIITGRKIGIKAVLDHLDHLSNKDED